MGLRGRWTLFVVTALVLLAGASWYAVDRARESQERRTAAPGVATSDAQAGPAVAPGRIMFRHSGLDEAYGHVASVPLADPGGARVLSTTACDRLAAWAEGLSCLTTKRGVVTRFEALELDADLATTQEHGLAGIPSRTRVSPSGRLVATTSFVTGHSYMTSGFSTATVVRETGGGRSWGNLERFAFLVDGRRSAPEDRNVWGVTFVDDRTFYATVATGGRTHLVRGDLAERTLTSVAEDAECPSLSPDGSRVAFKVDVSTGATKEWGLAVLDLASGVRTELGEATYGLDDQVEWLDDDTLLYGLARPDSPGVSDVWAVGTQAGASPRVLVEEASSPSVVR